MKNFPEVQKQKKPNLLVLALVPAIAGAIYLFVNEFANPKPSYSERIACESRAEFEKKNPQDCWK